MSDVKLFKWLGILVVLPLVFLFFTNDHFRYPCQNPDNWEQDYCKRPVCEVTRTCPEHIFKGQRDPRLDPQTTTTQGVICEK